MDTSVLGQRAEYVVRGFLSSQVAYSKWIRRV
jgi:hypothetical protein